MVAKGDIWLDRVVEDHLVDALKPGGPLRELVEFRDARQGIMDIQFRRPSGRVSRASLYAGLTRILDIDTRTDGKVEPRRFRFFVAHQTHRKAAPRHEAWRVWQPLDRLAGLLPEVERYLSEREEWFEREQEAAHHVIEGRVHAAMCSDAVTSYRVINREASPSFHDLSTKAEVCDRIRSEMRQVLSAVPEPKRWLKYREFGTSPDILAVDRSGRLIVAEAKPHTYTAGIVKGPIQARFYAGLIARWLGADPDAPMVLERMLEQRIEVGLARGPVPRFSADMPVVPVLAIGHGEVSARAMEHAVELRDALAGLAASEAGATASTEIWRLGRDGNVQDVA